MDGFERDPVAIELIEKLSDIEKRGLENLVACFRKVFPSCDIYPAEINQKNKRITIGKRKKDGAKGEKAVFRIRKKRNEKAEIAVNRGVVRDGQPSKMWQIIATEFGKDAFNIDHKLAYELEQLSESKGIENLRKDLEKIGRVRVNDGLVSAFMEGDKLLPDDYGSTTENSPRTKFKFKAKAPEGEHQCDRVTEKQAKNIELRHNQIIKKLYGFLVKVYGEENVGAEQNAGHGKRIDLAVKNNQGSGSFTFYELKTQDSLTSCFREGISQLLEYAYFPNANNAVKLVLVAPNPVSKDYETYLKHLRDKFNIPIYYLHFNEESTTLGQPI